MIFVTVGTAHYNPLIEEMDRLVETGVITDTVIAQIGRGSYVPKNFKSFRFIRSLNRAYDKAEVIVSTGGAGTTIECITQGLKLVVVENTTLMEGHQSQLIGAMSKRKHLTWCRDLKNLADCISQARTGVFPKFVSDTPRAHLLIQELLEEQ
ncbi:MAG: glycosyltransferase [Candidatus Thorarchaeota archaeon]